MTDREKGPGFRRVVRVPVYRQVADQLREAIVDGTMTPGSPIPPERDLVDSFGVSRASVREAIRSLVAEGLLVSEGSSPMRAVVASDLHERLKQSLSNVLKLHGAGLDDLVELRLILESAAVRRTAERRPSEELETAASALAAMRDITDDVEAFEAEDVRFHLALVQASGNEALYPIMLAIRDNISLHLLLALRSAPDAGATIARLTGEHAEIFDAISRGDGDRAAELMKAHIEAFYTAHHASQV